MVRKVCKKIIKILTTIILHFLGVNAALLFVQGCTCWYCSNNWVLIRVRDTMPLKYFQNMSLCFSPPSPHENCIWWRFNINPIATTTQLYCNTPQPYFQKIKCLETECTQILVLVLQNLSLWNNREQKEDPRSTLPRPTSERSIRGSGGGGSIKTRCIIYQFLFPKLFLKVGWLTTSYRKYLNQYE